MTSTSTGSISIFQNKRRLMWLLTTLLLLFFLTRINNLLLLPVFLDEAAHITRAQYVWQDKPFYLLTTGKALAPYLAAIFWPFVGQVFIGRYVVLLLGMLGIAACYAVGRELHSRQAGVFVMILWLLCTQLMFFERMALVDTTIGAMAMLTLWITIRMICSGRMRTALLCGVGLALCVFAKTTGILFWPMVGLAIFLLPNKLHWRRKVRLLTVTYVTAFLLVLPAAMYVSGTGEDPTGQKYGLTSVDPVKFSIRIPRNGRDILDAERTYFSVPMLALMATATIGALLLAPRRSLLLFILPTGLLVVIILTAGKLWLRYTVPAIPFALLLTVIGLLEFTRLWQAKRNSVMRYLPHAVTILWAAFICIPFQITAWTNPPDLPLPAGDQKEYIWWVASGYGIKEAATYLREVITEPTEVIVTAANCDGARMYIPYGSPITLICPGIDWGGWTETNKQIVADIKLRATKSDVYVIAEEILLIAPSYLPSPKTLLKRFPRPIIEDQYGIRVYRIEQTTTAHR